MLSVIIVNYRSADLLVQCLQSFYRYNQSLLHEIIVVDNDSKDESESVIKTQFPDVIWWPMGYNAGFARANNAGINAAKGHTYLLLNPDTIAMDDTISTCYNQLNSSPYVAAGVQLLNEDHSLQTSGSYFVKGGLNHLLPIPYWGDFIRWLGYRTGQQVPGIQEASAIQRVDWINGAFLMVKREAVVKAGLLDADFFLYSEEIEWCSRLKKVGDLVIFGTLHMIHLQGETINKKVAQTGKGYQHLFDKRGLQLMVSHHVRIRKQYGVFWFLFLLANYTWGIVVFGIGAFIHRLIRGQNPFKDFTNVGAYAKNVLRLWSLTPHILRNKPYFYKML